MRVDQSLSFKVYRKPIKSNTVILFHSDHSFSYKVSAFSSFIKRAFLICSGASLQTELSFIKRIAAEHGFPAKVIDRITVKHMNPTLKIKDETKSTVIYRKFGYVTGIYERLKRYFRPYNIHLVAIPKPNVINLLSRKLDLNPLLVYLAFTRYQSF